MHTEHPHSPVADDFSSDFDYEPKDFLLFALRHYNIPLEHTEGNMIYVAGGYAIEIEGKKLFKLLSDGTVIAPFTEVSHLCSFILDTQQ